MSDTVMTIFIIVLGLFAVILMEKFWISYSVIKIGLSGAKSDGFIKVLFII